MAHWQQYRKCRYKQETGALGKVSASSVESIYIELESHNQLHQNRSNEPLRREKQLDGFALPVNCTCCLHIRISRESIVSHKTWVTHSCKHTTWQNTCIQYRANMSQCLHLCHWGTGVSVPGFCFSCVCLVCILYYRFFVLLFFKGPLQIVSIWQFAWSCASEICSTKLIH